jgi:hypothetical protein
MVFSRFFLYGFLLILSQALQAAHIPERDRDKRGSLSRLCPSFLTFPQPPSAEAPTEESAPLPSKKPDPLYKKALQQGPKEEAQQHFSDSQMTIIKKGEGGKIIYLPARKDPTTGHFVPISKE